MTLDAVGDEHAPGHVRLAGERWLAVSGSDDVLPAGTAVVVTAVRGTTLWVWPLLGAAASVVLADPGAMGPVPGSVSELDSGADVPSDPTAAPDGAEGATS